MTDRTKYWAQLDKKIFSEMRETLGSDSAAREYTDQMITELKDFYTIYLPELVDWFAGLYEPEICFTLTEDTAARKRYSGGAGFYFSNSARDHYRVIRDGKMYQLLPDAETTAQVFAFLLRSGMLWDVDGDVRQAFPEGEAERIIRFIKALQEPDSGCFYHPQWLSMLGTADFWDSRRARDLTYSLSVLRHLGAAPTYDTPSGVKGDGILYDGTEISRTETGKTGENAAEQPKTVKVHPRLESEETFRAYLATLSLPGNSYFVGNELASLAPEILARDKTLGTAENPRPLASILDAWMREYQNPETGVWHDNVKHPVESIYYPINGVLKIAAMYNTLQPPFPNPLAAAKSAFAVITAKQPISHVCDLYNTWFTVDFINYNLKKYSGKPELAKKILSDIRIAAIPAVRATRLKMQENRLPDGSFMYHRIFKSTATPDNPLGYSVSQNAPVGLKYHPEGDVNATVIFTYGILDFMFSALDFGEIVPICDASDRERFKTLIVEKAARVRR